MITRTVIRAHALRLLVAGAGLACSAADEEPARATASDTVAAAAPASVALQPWYLRARTLDLTGDGIADSVRLAAGPGRPDSMQVVLTLLVAGQEKHREEWGSGYELTLVDSTLRSSPRVEPVLRAKLDSVLASVRVERFGAPGVRVMAEDSAIMAGLVPRPTVRVSFSYGFESTTNLAWDAPRSRFVRLFSCC